MPAGLRAAPPDLSGPALGAWAAAPGRPVVAVTGDGGFGQYAAGFPVWHTSLHNPGWAAYARLCGAIGIKADCRDQLDQAMTQLFAADGPAMLHVLQDPELL
jgi:pyruvate oxidase